MALAYLGIGTNVGHRELNIENCIVLIRERIGDVKSVSSIYETEPWGVEGQDNYYNIVVEVETSLYPLSLLQSVQEIENDLGRIRIEKWGSRIIDVDILFYDYYVFSMDNLIIPHPYITKRNFVLEPLSEISPDLIHPKLRLSIETVKALCEDKNWIKRLEA
jgi:2-amino-4-hydroxy-6-hydroxymethyldihydropteridine diphosphokinase